MLNIDTEKKYKHKPNHLKHQPELVCFVFYVKLAEGPGVARGTKKIWRKNCEKDILNFLSLWSPRPPMSVQKRIQPKQLSRLAGYTLHVNIRMSCFIIN